MASMQRDKGIFEGESSTKPTDYPGMWRVPRINPDNCCIYRVPDCMRKVNPEAYTPQLLLIGPLHYSLKSQALKSCGGVTDTKSMGYLNMEAYKKFYLTQFEHRLVGTDTIKGLKRIIEENEETIRESYSESTTWIESSEFVEMILHDSVFIIEFILRLSECKEGLGDPLIENLCLVFTVQEDLILLENQLPYSILEKLFDRGFPAVTAYGGLRQMIIKYFDFTGKIKDRTTFRHFTDLERCVRVETIEDELATHRLRFSPSIRMYNMEKLNSGGVKFEAVQDEYSLNVRFENGCLKVPCLTVDNYLERTLRNIIALEQCHYTTSLGTFVSNYVMFLDYLIDTDKDVDLLVEKGIIKYHIGESRSAAEMVNKLCLGISSYSSGSYYSAIAAEVNAYYVNQFNRSLAILKNVYFGNLWTGTAAVAATLLLLMTLTQTVTSILQVT